MVKRWTNEFHLMNNFKDFLYAIFRVLYLNLFFSSTKHSGKHNSVCQVGFFWLINMLQLLPFLLQLLAIYKYTVTLTFIWPNFIKIRSPESLKLFKTNLIFLFLRLIFFLSANCVHHFIPNLLVFISVRNVENSILKHFSSSKNSSVKSQYNSLIW